jgi:tetratricopeptide (TPR) repeat protein
MLEELQRLVEAADFDSALEKLKSLGKEELEATIRGAGSPIKVLRFACMASDVYDYAGRYSEAHPLPDAASCIGLVQDEAKRAVDLFLQCSGNKKYQSVIENSRFIKQCCWALIHMATVEYRKNNYTQSLTLLEGTVKQALEALEKQRTRAAKSSSEDERLSYRGFGVHGTQSRLWYGIGLIKRQLREERDAREAFDCAIRYAGPEIDSRELEEKSAAFYDYSIGKALGLGLGWISYSEARLLESLAELVAARRLLPRRGVHFISSYLDVIYARALLSSSSDDAERVAEAVATLEHACKTLAGHELYYHRARYALALGLVSRYSVSKDETGVLHPDLHRAMEMIDTAQRSSWLARKDRSTRCSFLILKSRILRILQDYDGALEAAISARNLGQGIDFVKADCWICEGEAYFHKRDYQPAISNFERAYKSAEKSRKLHAACQLHLARTHLESGDRAAARDYFRKWKSARAGVENVFIRNLASDLEAKLNDFVVDAQVESLKAHVNELKYWIAAEALSRCGDRKGKDRQRFLIDLTGMSYRQIVRWSERDFGKEE